jgi:hypothetical protein
MFNYERIFSMRIRLILSAILLLSCMTFAQKRVLVSPANDVVVPIPKGYGASAYLKKIMAARRTENAKKAPKKTTGVCNAHFIFGDCPVNDPHSVNGTEVTNIDNIGNANDIFAMWDSTLEAGTIDSMFFNVDVNSTDPWTGGTDSVVSLRVFGSNIYPHHRPGDGGYLPPERLFWGYFPNSNDWEDGVAAFPEDATAWDTIMSSDGTRDSVVSHWVSTYAYNKFNIVFASPTDSVAPANGGPPWEPLTHQDSVNHLGQYSGRCTATECYWDTTLITYPPTIAGEELVGGGVGIDIKVRPNADPGANPQNCGSIDLLDAGLAPTVNIGDVLFFTVRCLEDPTATNPYSSGMSLTGQYSPTPGTDLSAPQTQYDSRNWKFYELRPVGIPYSDDTAQTAHGWFARGEFNLHIWYSMNVTSNTPPTYPSIDALHNTFDTSLQTVSAELQDCNAANPSLGGVAYASLLWQTNINGVISQVYQEPMSTLDQTNFSANIPGYSPGTIVTYWLSSMGNDSVGSSSERQSYIVMAFRNSSTYPDTNTTYTPAPIRGTPGVTRIDSTAWFVAKGVNLNGQTPLARALDDGTSGPYSLGGPFLFFGDTMYYAWVGMNGAIALSKDSTDTIDVDWGGYYSNSVIPFTQNKSHNDSTTLNDGPRNYIAPWSNDLIYTALGEYLGNIWVKQVGSTWTVEYDSVGYFNSNGNGVKSSFIVRVIIDRSAGTIEYQYDDVGLEGKDTTATVGLQADFYDSTYEVRGYSMLVYSGYPTDIRPVSGLSIKYLPEVYTSVTDGWNMVSVGNSPLNGNFSTSFLYPTGTSSAFNYSNGYHPQTTLTNGAGYWMKFGSSAAVGTPGTIETSRTDTLHSKWNMIGSVSGAVPVSSLTTNPTGIIHTNVIYGYSPAGYQTTPDIFPGRAYWVKSTSEGNITFTAGGGSVPKMVASQDDFSKLSSITVRNNIGQQKLYIGNEDVLKSDASAYELPPVPPVGAFDARFGTQSMVATYPSNLQTGKSYVYPILIQSSSYPVTVQWNVKSNPGTRKYVITDGLGGRILGNNVMKGSGSLRIDNKAVNSLVIKLVEGVNTPTSFALSQNYPNPFNPTTRMTVDVPQTAVVDVTVYDILGRKIANLMSGEQPAGAITIEWNGLDSHGLTVPTGMYFVRMTSNAFSAVRKIMMMK